MANQRDRRSLGGDSQPPNAGRGAAVLPGPLHAAGDRGDDAPLAGGAVAGSGPPVSRSRRADRRLDDDGDTGRTVASAWGGRVPAGARSASSQDTASRRLTIAIPSKGRLREPAVALLAAAGLGPEQPGERALAVPCRNAPVDVTLVRAADIPEDVQDEVVARGVTGADLVEESGVSVDVLLGLGFGACTLEAAVPAESSATALDDLAGARVATVYPNLAQRLLGERGVEVELVRVTGAVEVAPRLGLADAIVDLVSSGSTLRTNGLRSLGALLSSGALLIARRGSDDRVRGTRGV